MRSLLATCLVLVATTLAALPAAFAQDDDAPPAASSTEGAHLNDARALYQAGHWEDALAAFNRAFELAPDRSEIKAAAALEAGSLLWEQGRYEPARQKVTFALELARELNLDHATGQLLLTLGQIESATGQLRSAEDTLNICVQLTGEINDEVYRALCRISRRAVRTLLGQNPGSESDLRADIRTLQNTDSLLAIGTALTRTADLYQDNGDLEQAQRLLAQAKRHIEAADSVPARARHHLREAQLLRRQNNLSAASELLGKALPLFESMNNRPMIVHTLGLQAEIAALNNQAAQSLTLYRRALNVADTTSNPLLKGRVHLALCELNIPRAPQHCQQAIDTFETGQLATYRVRAHASLARAHQAANRFNDARTHYMRAIELIDDLPEGNTLYNESLATQHANLCVVNTRQRATGSLASCLEARERLQKLPDADAAHHRRTLSHVTHAAGMAALQENNAERAIDLLQNAADQALALSPPDLAIASDALLRLGATYAALPDHARQARDAFTRGLDALNLPDQPEGSDNRPARLALLTQLTQLHLNQRDADDTLSRAARLIDLAAELDDARTQAWAHNARASAHLLNKDQDAARAELQRALPLARQADDAELTELIEDNLKRFES
ncbi:hypothetical protein EA187_18785 [Lujinxingia sediminis]|uniref:Tetratricopeptide repeat protein n=1 Tax=Lujinxingia sediminis TaxID=2480984 RepID=A0ABY0CN76_9DELT|nr:hypothetical protein [Lujinxingia sediminis]RVU41391.1 hypothetical protein EA187_18785 [Lujinxingia sediminis]